MALWSHIQKLKEKKFIPRGLDEKNKNETCFKLQFSSLQATYNVACIHSRNQMNVSFFLLHCIKNSRSCIIPAVDLNKFKGLQYASGCLTSLLHAGYFDLVCKWRNIPWPNILLCKSLRTLNPCSRRKLGWWCISSQSNFLFLLCGSGSHRLRKSPSAVKSVNYFN